MNKKDIAVGVLTVSLQYLLTNYGSFYQHFAIRLLLKRLGFNSVRVSHPSEKFWFFEWIYSFIRYFVYRPFLHNSSVVRSILMGSGFVWAHFVLYMRASGLRRAYGLGLIGSDQIWGYSGGWIFMSELSRKMPCVAYAVSCDWSRKSRDAGWLDLARKDVPNLFAVSVRENAGICLLKNICNKEIVRTVDPVWLGGREMMDEIANKGKKLNRPTILCYIVNVKNRDDFPFENLKDASKILQCDLQFVAIQGAELFVSKDRRLYPSPSELISYIRDAKYVITNSFHGTLLSLLYHKRFVTIKQICATGANQNTRQMELVDALALKRKLLEANTNAAEIVSVLQENIEWQYVDRLMQEERQKSLDWLKQALAG